MSRSEYTANLQLLPVSRVRQIECDVKNGVYSYRYKQPVVKLKFVVLGYALMAMLLGFYVQYVR